VTRHAISRSAWDPKEREEYDALLAEVCAATTDSTERLDLFEQKLADAIQAQRPWAGDVARACRRFGLGKEITRHEGRSRALVSYLGDILSVPSVQARRVTVDGVNHYQRELIYVWTWDELIEKRAEALRSRRTYTANIQLYDRLLALRELSPDAASPADAATSLGLDLDEWLFKAA
jgi:hypothetical protein